MRMSQIRYEIDRLEDMIMYLELGQEKNRDFYIQVRNIREEVDKIEETFSGLKLEIKHLEDQSL